MHDGDMAAQWFARLGSAIIEDTESCPPVKGKSAGLIDRVVQRKPQNVTSLGDHE